MLKNNNPNDLAEYNGALFYSGLEQGRTSNNELWKSDGTAAGTVMIKNINPTGGDNPEGITQFNGALYFSADDGVSDTELWKAVCE